MPPDMVGGGLGPGHAWPLGGGGHSVAEVLFAPGALQGKEPGPARRILNLLVCSAVWLFFFVCNINILESCFTS